MYRSLVGRLSRKLKLRSVQIERQMLKQWLMFRWLLFIRSNLIPNLVQFT